jgi:hypothetical protein
MLSLSSQEEQGLAIVYFNGQELGHGVMSITPGWLLRAGSDSPAAICGARPFLCVISLGGLRWLDSFMLILPTFQQLLAPGCTCAAV